MSDERHTPGPWAVFNRTDVFARSMRGNFSAPDNDGWQVADCSPANPVQIGDRFYGLSVNEQRANAILIASAPDLLAACQAMLDAIHRHYPNDWSGLQAQANAAISKATS